MNYLLTVSEPIVGHSNLSLNHEAIDVIDVNSDGFKDIVIANGGDILAPTQASDPSIDILEGTEAYTFERANTSALPPSGWINDFVFKDNGVEEPLSILSIDHGREVAYESEYWSPIQQFVFSDDQYIDISDRLSNNRPDFYHNSSNSGDLNEDGETDFVVASMGTAPNIHVYLGEPNQAMHESSQSIFGESYENIVSWSSDLSLGAGAAGFIDAGADGDLDIVRMPYGVDSRNSNSYSGQILEFEGGRYVDSHFFPAVQKTSLLDDGWGYSYLETEDLDLDGDHDLVGLAELPWDSVGGTQILNVFLQDESGKFELIDGFPSEPEVLTRGGEPVAGRVWQENKIQVEDINSDGYPDLHWGHWFGGELDRIVDGIFLNNSEGQFFRAEPSDLELFSSQVWAQMEQIVATDDAISFRSHMADLNSDGIGDLILFGQTWLEVGADFIPSTTVYTLLSQRDGELGVTLTEASSYVDIISQGSDLFARDHLIETGYIKIENRLHLNDTSFAFDVTGSLGQTVKTLAAVIGEEGLSNKEYIGIGLQLFDAGQSLAAVCERALTAVGATTNEDVVNLLYTNLYGEAPTVDVAQPFIDALNNGGFTKGSLAAAAAELTDDLGVIDLVGLAETGVEYI